MISQDIAVYILILLATIYLALKLAKHLKNLIKVSKSSSGACGCGKKNSKKV